MKIIAFDIDDVLCYRDKIHEQKGIEKYKYCLPIDKNIRLVNECYDNGFYIKLYTARGMSTLKSDVESIKENLLPITEQFLEKNNVKYHELIFGKTHFDLLIDDKAKNINDINTFEDIKDFLNGE